MKYVFIFLCVLILNSTVVLAAENFLYDSHERRDPLWPLVTESGSIVSYDTNLSVGEMTLEGVVVDLKGGLAIINGNVIGQGHTVGGYMLKEVHADYVVLSKDGQVSTLCLKKGE